ncbi:MAG: hypothetical protein OXI40_17475 [Chloroflexota bacterium]|nr:hypothetical protein [Chloroflexota bacterium]
MTDVVPADAGYNPNPFIGIILLIVLLVFVLPDRLPQFISDLSPYFFAGIPCARLPAARDLAAHQSVIGRSVQDPLQLAVAPAAPEDSGALHIRLTVSNNSLGTLPIVFQEDNIVVAAGDGGRDGFGFIVAPEPAEGAVGRQAPDPVGYAESDIRLLGPRQRCVHALDLVASQDMIDNGGTIRAYYRMSLPGEHQARSEGKPAIYADQGLDFLSEGVVFSASVDIAPGE